MSSSAQKIVKPSAIRSKNGWVSVREVIGPIKRWSKRYASLRERTLNFYKSETSSSPTDSLNLYQVQSITRTNIKPYCFEIILDKGHKEIMSVKTEDEMYSWMDVIERNAPSLAAA